ncbi:hypothetical protein Hanom_Chr05g00409441 [Helianthus anomalus]
MKRQVKMPNFYHFVPSLPLQLPIILISCEAFNVIIILCNSIVALSISTSVSSHPILRRGSMKSITKFLLYFPITRSALLFCRTHDLGFHTLQFPFI